jgi:2-oxoglutarate ferredoxin oxidoreductase subunit delta
MEEAKTAASVKKKEKPPVRIEVIFENCKACDICVDICPQNVLAMRKEPSKWEGYIVEVVNLEKCTRCMLCEVHCPDFAIKVY